MKIHFEHKNIETFNISILFILYWSNDIGYTQNTYVGSESQTSYIDPFHSLGEHYITKYYI